MSVEQILAIVSAVASFLFVTLIPSIIALVKYIKNYKNAKTDAERQAIYNSLMEEVTELIKKAEETYKSVDEVLKTKTGKGAGAVKKEMVLSKLQNSCYTKGLEFDADFWSKKVDELVALTKNVN